MRVFVTGATGFIGKMLTPELIAHGHQVLGLTRSDAGAKALAAAGAEAHRGDLKDLERLKAGAAKSDAVIHLAFNHDFANFVENCEMDRRVIEALGSALAGSDRPLVVTSGTAMVSGAPGRAATEGDALLGAGVIPRAASEEAAAAVAARGGRTVVVRLPQVHDTEKQGLIPYVTQTAREKGRSAYLGDGSQRWPAAHVSDVARLYRLALEKGRAGAKYHAVDEEGIAMKEIAEVIGRGLGVPVVSLAPEEAQAHFGWLAHFAAMDMPASSALTRKELGWEPKGPDLLTDLRNMKYA